MRILGIDPGSLKIGWAIIEKKGNRFSHVESGVLKFDPEKKHILRLKEIKSQLSVLAETKQFDAVAMESLIYVKSPTSLIKLAQTRGIIIGELIDYSIYEYSPNLVKSTVTGYGHSNKEIIQKFLRMILGNLEFETDDQSDACAIALCHYLTKAGVNSKIKSSGKGTSSLKDAVKHRIEGGM